VGGVRALWPVDPDGGGTWIGVNDRGVAASLLNVNPAHADHSGASGLASRGAIIPAIIDVSRAADAIKRLGGLDLACFRPFRVVIADVRSIFEAAWDRRTLRVERRPLAPACFVSSGLGDARALPRLDLWREWLRIGRPNEDLQDAFHRHQWADRPEISVRMSRADARTVSTTVVEVRGGALAARRPGAIVMRYTDDAHAVVRRLDRAESPNVALACSGERARC
jgi:uncharacterized protein with NRDE domain